MTTHAHHATEICQRLDLSSCDIIATVSGDGLLHEAVQGLMARPDWAQAILKPIAIIPGGMTGGGGGLLVLVKLTRACTDGWVCEVGSGNGLAEVIGCSNASTTAFAIVKGSPTRAPLRGVPLLLTRQCWQDNRGHWM